MKRLSENSKSLYFHSEKGLTLIEILASMTILSIIIVSLLTMFVQSSRANTYSKTIVNSTYIAESNMEIVQNLIGSSTSIDGLITPMTSEGFTKTTNGCLSGACYEKTSNGRYVFVQLMNTDSTNLTADAKVKIYKDNTRASQEAQMELILPWKK